MKSQIFKTANGTEKIKLIMDMIERQKEIIRQAENKIKELEERIKKA